MKKKDNKLDIRPPFENSVNNWELINAIQASLGRSLTNPHLYTNIQPGQEVQRLGRANIQNILRALKTALQIIDHMRNQQKQIEIIKLNAQIAHQKLQQHEQIIRNYEKKFNQRTKTLVDENRILKQTAEKVRKQLSQNDENNKNILDAIKKENQQLKFRQSELESQNRKLLQAFSEIQESMKSQTQKYSKLTSLTEGDDRALSLKDRLTQLESYQSSRKTFFRIKNEKSTLEWMGLTDGSALAQLLKFLTPSQICRMATLNRQMRLMILKSRQCVFALSQSVLAVKNRKISYYHRHIEHFQRLYNRIPEEVLQLTYFKYHILKENIGQEIMAILNSSATIFEGKFAQGQELYVGIGLSTEEYEFKFNLKEATILEVDKQIIDEYRGQRGQERERLLKLFQSMYGKISNTFQLYRADIESSRLFIENILKHFSRVFVLAKSLYMQAQNLQQLNSFLITELNKWDRMEIDKELQLEDLKAQLQAEKKLKLFFTDKSIKSQQKALIQQNLKLTFQMKYGKLVDLMNVTCAEKDELARKNEILTQSNEQLSLQSRQLRKRYENVLEKHSKLTEELAIVKQTIIKMNII